MHLALEFGMVMFALIKGTRPANQLLTLVALLLIPALLWPDLDAWIVPVAVASGVLGLDLVWCWTVDPPEVQRHIAPNIPVNRESTVRIRLHNRTSQTLRFEVYDEVPDDCRVAGMPRTLRLPGGASAEVAYSLTVTRRGDARLGRIICLLRSPFGFWQRKVSLGESHSVRVYPDFSVISNYLELVSDQHSIRMGIKLMQRRGEGLEFQQLREYREGDTIRQIDWKATARRQALISREYQEERDQRVLFLIDSGRRMRTRDGVLSHFDHALNGMLLLAYVALRQGDSVALKLFGAERKWVPAQRGVGSVNLLLNEVYDLHTGTEAADYISAAEDVMVRQRKRSLIVLMTNLREEDADLLPALKLLRQRHVVILANLRESVLDATAQQMPTGFEEALRVAGTFHHLAQRQQYQKQCLPLAHMVLDCTPHELPVRVVNAYWQIKRSGKL
ncbi:MAG: DUF58 domain-containing protein [Gammaproteobacteria bacterium]|nr:DUF58 domain-containing protein [Gammaproteobacteria bacterium]